MCGICSLLTTDNAAGQPAFAQSVRRMTTLLQRGLKKVDMASMFCSLEVRVPLLDREVIDIALRIDPFSCIVGTKCKMVLENLLARYVPAKTIPQQKRGFAMPVEGWLRGSLKPLVTATLFDTNHNLISIFDTKRLQQYCGDFLEGKQNSKWGIWTLLTLFWWVETHYKNTSRLIAQI